MISLGDVVAFLDRLLVVDGFPDYPDAHNGLQWENSGVVNRVACAVDASERAIAAASDHDADLLLVHHGLYWSLRPPLVGRPARKIRRLLSHDIAVYAAHLPLDAHPIVGNNILLLTALGAEPRAQFGRFGDELIGWWGTIDATRDTLSQRLSGLFGADPLVMPFGPKKIRRVGVVTGGGGSMIAEAKEAGLDLFITGEGPHHTYFDAEELGINVVYAGHYATEIAGVHYLGAMLNTRFDLPFVFLDQPTGL